MEAAVIKSVFQFRRARAEEWESVNPVLRVGEPGYVTDLKRHKIGDGVTPWNDLMYSEGEEFVVNKDTHYDFPSIGKPNVIYKAESEKMIYQWNSIDLKYEPINAGEGGNISNIEIICGGTANDE